MLDEELVILSLQGFRVTRFQGPRNWVEKPTIHHIVHALGASPTIPRSHPDGSGGTSMPPQLAQTSGTRMNRDTYTGMPHDKKVHGLGGIREQIPHFPGEPLIRGPQAVLALAYEVHQQPIMNILSASLALDMLQQRTHVLCATPASRTLVRESGASGAQEHGGPGKHRADVSHVLDPIHAHAAGTGVCLIMQH